MSSPLAHYESFLLNNGSTISTLESSLRSLTWFLPGRFKDAELASEALSASLNLMSLYHDTLLSRILRSDPKFKPLIPPSAHTRYTRAWAEKDVRYKWAARLLEILRFIELVVEMSLRRKASPKNRWRAIILIEIIKAYLRLTIVTITRRPILSPPIPERDIDPATIPTSSNASSPTLAPSSSYSSSPPSTPKHLQNNHISLDTANMLLTPPPPLQSDSPVEDYLLPKALSSSSVKSPTSLIRPLSTPKDWLSEIVYIARPLIYVAALGMKYEATNPLVVSLSLELLSRHLRRTPPASSALERAEYARRDRDILWYIFRGSIWKSFTRPKLEAFANKTSHAPLLGLISAFIKDWVPLIDEYYYYTAT
ncbi:peroxisomal membrane protein PEX16 [Rickenella mellea]|uniref:Peroxisomal membrane protein PEX16 n=1 Tax=Rickenella mellea TaxID=50990 RepID=A0A4Y7QMZ4_9AGAM|nr:peroxisomal membrane protein PEX16 [Rickenella mellea]